MKAKQEFIDFINSEQTKENFIIDGQKYILIKSPMKYKNGYNIYIDNNSECGNLSLVYFLSTSLTGEIYNIQHSENISRTEKNVPILFRTLYDNFIDFEGKSYDKNLEENDKKILDMIEERKTEEKIIEKELTEEWKKEYNYETIKKDYINFLYESLKKPTTVTSVRKKNLILSGDFISAYNASCLNEYLKEEFKYNEKDFKNFLFSKLAKKDFKNELKTNENLEKEKILLENETILHINIRHADNTTENISYDTRKMKSFEKENIIKNHKFATRSEEYLLDQIEKIEKVTNLKTIELYNKPITIDSRDMMIKALQSDVLNFWSSNKEKWIEPFKDDKEIAELLLLKNPHFYSDLNKKFQEDKNFLEEILEKLELKSSDPDLKYCNDIVDLIMNIPANVFLKDKDFTKKILQKILDYPYRVSVFAGKNFSKDNVDEKIVFDIINAFKNYKINGSYAADTDYLSAVSEAIKLVPEILKNEEIKKFVLEHKHSCKYNLWSIDDFDILTDIFTIDELADNMLRLNDKILEDKDIITILLGSKMARPLMVGEYKIINTYKDDKDISKLIGLTVRDNNESRLFVNAMGYSEDIDYLKELAYNNYNYYSCLDSQGKEDFIWNESLSVNNFVIENNELVFHTENGKMILYPNQIKISNDSGFYDNSENWFLLRTYATSDMELTKIVYQSLENFLNENYDIEKFKSKSYSDFFEKLEKISKITNKSKEKDDDISI